MLVFCLILNEQGGNYLIMNSEGSLLGKWGVCQWFGDESMVNKDDLEEFFKLSPNGKIFYCVNGDGQYIYISYNNKTFKVHSCTFKEVPEPLLKIGENIIVRDSKEVGKIVDISWHYKRKEAFYYILSNDKRKSKRFFIEDLISEEKRDRFF